MPIPGKEGEGLAAISGGVWALLCRSEGGGGLLEYAWG